MTTVLLCFVLWLYHEPIVHPIISISLGLFHGTGLKFEIAGTWGRNWSNSQIPQCACLISHNASSRTEMCTVLFWMVHCGIWEICIVGFVTLVDWTATKLWQNKALIAHFLVHYIQNHTKLIATQEKRHSNLWTKVATGHHFVGPSAVHTWIHGHKGS